MAEAGLLNSIEQAKIFFLSGREFDYDLPSRHNLQKSLQAIYGGSARKPNSAIILNSSERVLLARSSEEIAQLLAYSVSQKYKVLIKRNDGRYVLHFVKQ